MAPSPTPERSSRGPIAVLLAGIATTVVGWLVFTIGIFVVVGEGEDGSTAVQNGAAVVVVLGAVVGSVGPFLITGGAMWWAFSARRRSEPGQVLTGSAGRIVS